LWLDLLSDSNVTIPAIMFQSSTQRKPRPMSFIPNDDADWQNTISNNSPKPSPSPRGAPYSEETGLVSIPLASNRWSRGVHGSDYTSLDHSKNSSAAEINNKDVKNASSISVESKGFSSYTDIFPSDNILKQYSEASKVAIKRGLRGNWTKLVPHILAVSVSLAVCQLSFRDAYWMDLRPPNVPVAFGLTQEGALNFLQLAAKLHELLILASISALVLHAVQTHLTGRSGLPLGMIANAFELGSAQFLRRKAFWSFLWQVDPATGKAFPYMRFWLLSLFSTILVTLAGPSSAIAVIPTLNYFDVPRPFEAPVLPYYVWNVSTELWPTELTAASLNAPSSGIACNDPDSDADQEICPVGGFDDTYDWAGGLLFADTDTGTNISFPDATGATRRIVSARSCNSTFDGRASAVTLNSFISGALTSYVSALSPSCARQSAYLTSYSGYSHNKTSMALLWRLLNPKSTLTPKPRSLHPEWRRCATRTRITTSILRIQTIKQTWFSQRLEAQVPFQSQIGRTNTATHKTHRTLPSSRYRSLARRLHLWVLS
jgi:hypothetical protein